MLTAAEMALLESLLTRARSFAGVEWAAGLDPINVGDVVQLRPGADPHWETSLLVVTKIREDAKVTGYVLRPHRSGCREAWYTYTPPEVIRIGGSPFPGPGRAIRNQSYPVLCPKCARRK
jgi:hypothetical protein